MHLKDNSFHFWNGLYHYVDNCCQLVSGCHVKRINITIKSVLVGPYIFLSLDLKIRRCVDVIVMSEECSKNRKSSDKIIAVGTSAYTSVCL